METDEYTPRKGTVAHTILEFLRKQAPGAQFTGKQLQDKLKVKWATIGLRKAVEAGVIVVEKLGNEHAYSLPAPPQPPDGRLTIACWSDGDTMVVGGQSNEDGSVTFTREQLLQLVAFVSQPALVMPVPMPVAVPAATPLLTAPQE